MVVRIFWVFLGLILSNEEWDTVSLEFPKIAREAADSALDSKNYDINSSRNLTFMRNGHLEYFLFLGLPKYQIIFRKIETHNGSSLRRV